MPFVFFFSIISLCRGYCHIATGMFPKLSSLLKKYTGVKNVNESCSINFGKIRGQTWIIRSRPEYNNVSIHFRPFRASPDHFVTLGKTFTGAPCILDNCHRTGFVVEVSIGVGTTYFKSSEDRRGAYETTGSHIILIKKMLLIVKPGNNRM